jgi:predicted nucleic-acid-binding protein
MGFKMIGLDTNVLVRYLMQDDPHQSAQATALMETLSVTNRGFVSLVVISEFVWVLSYVFQLSRNDVNVTLGILARMPELRLEKVVVFLRALRLCNTTSADFADCLIVSVAKRAGCSHTVTFDRKAAAKLPNMARID